MSSDFVINSQQLLVSEQNDFSTKPFVFYKFIPFGMKKTSGYRKFTLKGKSVEANQTTSEL